MDMLSIKLKAWEGCGMEQTEIGRLFKDCHHTLSGLLSRATQMKEDVMSLAIPGVAGGLHRVDVAREYLKVDGHHHVGYDTNVAEELTVNLHAIRRIEGLTPQLFAKVLASVIEMASESGRIVINTKPENTFTEEELEILKPLIPHVRHLHTGSITTAIASVNKSMVRITMKPPVRETVSIYA